MKKYNIFIITLTVVFFTLGSSSVVFAKSTTKKILDNGMTVVISEMPTSPMVSVYGLVKTGSATEGKFLGSGITHFLEHMVFKGTPNYGVGEIPAKIQAVGGTINASTGMDHTIYTITVPFDSFDTAVEILAELLMNANMDAEEIEKEREVIHGEMRLYNDNPDRLINRLTFANVYLRHPYRHPVIGYRHLLDQIDRDDILEYYKERYSPNNTVLSIAGNVDAKKIMPKIEEVFKEFKRNTEILRNLPDEPQQISFRRYEHPYPTKLARLSMAFSGVSLLDSDLYALDVLGQILGEGESSRLNKDIYDDKKLVYSIGAYNYTPVDRGAFEISSLLEKENVDAVIEAALVQIQKIKDKGVSSKELLKAQRQVLSSRVFRQQTSSSVAYSQAYDEAFTGDHQFSDKYVDAIKNVTEEDIIRVAKKYLNEESLTIVVLKPEEQLKEFEEKKKKTIGAIEKFTLDNGLGILIREDHSFESVHIRLVSKGGLLEENTEVKGISNLMAQLWGKGTKSYGPEKLAELRESLGMQIGPFSGKNSFGVAMNFLSEDIDTALDILEDMVKYPLFDEDELDKLKGKVKASIDRRKDNISKYTGLALREHLYYGHPYGYPEDGTIETVDNTKRSDIVEYYKSLMIPQNMILAVYGDFQVGEVLEELERRLGKLKGNGFKRQENQVTSIVEKIEVEENLNKEQAMVMIGFHGVDIQNDDRYGLEVLSSILGSSFSGRLFTKVREEFGQAYTLGGASVPGIDTGYVYFYVLTSPESVESVKELLVKEIELVGKEKVSDQELSDMKSYLKGRDKADRETNFSLAFSTSLDELYGLGFDNYKEYDRKIDAVTADDILQLANTYLDMNKSVVVITRPKAQEQ